LQPIARGPHRDIQGMDKHCARSLEIFPLSHINEYIWNEIEANPNNLRGTNTGEIISRKLITSGTELTLGLGLYEYDWGHFKRGLFERALACIHTLCTLQKHHQYQAYTSALIDNLKSLTVAQFAQIQHLHGPLQALLQLIEGDTILPLQGQSTVGSLHIDNRTLTSYIRQLSLVHAFTSMHVFRQAEHPDRRKARYYD
jgi:hypothetical protein